MQGQRIPPSVIQHLNPRNGALAAHAHLGPTQNLD